MTDLPLSISATVTLDATGAGTITLGPGSAKGPAIWDIGGVVLQTSRPGKAPIPKAQVYLDTVDPSNSLGVTYDASFNTAPFTPPQTLTRGRVLIAVFTGGQSGDVATMTLTGTKRVT